MSRDRRQFIRGQWIPQTAKMPSPQGTVEIASILVQTLPERLAAAERSISAINGAEIYARDPRGKLVVVLEGTDCESAIGETLTTISTLPEVITATLVYHNSDAGVVDAQKATS